MIDTARPKPKFPTRLLPDRLSLLRIHRSLRTRTSEVPASSQQYDSQQYDSQDHGSQDHGQSDLELSATILARIESRLPGRLRHLSVRITENAVVLTGQCCTFYTKQLAQHIAMGVLEHEQLINNIDVRVAK